MTKNSKLFPQVLLNRMMEHIIGLSTKVTAEVSKSGQSYKFSEIIVGPIQTLSRSLSHIVL